MVTAEIVDSPRSLVTRIVPLPAWVGTRAWITVLVHDTIWFAGVGMNPAPPLFASRNSRFLVPPNGPAPKLFPLTVTREKVPAVEGDVMEAMVGNAAGAGPEGPEFAGSGNVNGSIGVYACPVIVVKDWYISVTISL